MQKQRIKSNSAYTLLEVMLAVSIAMIIAGWGVVNISDIVIKQKGQAAAIGLYKELTGLPALARKHDTPYYVKFSSNDYKIYKETGATIGWDAGDEEIPILEKPDIKVAFPTGVTTGPAGIEDDAAIAGNWSGTNGFSIGNDNLNTMNSGAVYIQNTSLPEFGFCIGVKPNSRAIKIYTWAGGQWNEY